MIEVKSELPESLSDEGLRSRISEVEAYLAQMDFEVADLENELQCLRGEVADAEKRYRDLRAELERRLL